MGDIFKGGVTTSGVGGSDSESPDGSDNGPPELHWLTVTYPQCLNYHGSCN